jgi:hypothetical protein
MKITTHSIVVLALLLSFHGCGPAISEEELGEVMFTLPKMSAPPPVEAKPAPAQADGPAARE